MFALIEVGLSALLVVSLKSIALALSAGMCLVGLRIRDSNVHHRVWSAVLLAMLFMPALGWVTPSLAIPAAIAPLQSIMTLFERAPQSTDVSEEISAALNHGAEIGILTAASEVQIDSLEAQRSNSTATWVKLLFAGYAVGLTVMLGRLCLGIWSTQRVVSRGRRIHPFGAGKTVVVENKAVRVPLTVGVFRPRILLPTDWSSWNTGMLTSVLRHEQAHIDRKDLLVVLLAEINRCVYWFHPLAWLLRKRLAALAEHSCDDSVILATGDRSEYAGHLLDIARRMSRTPGDFGDSGAVIPRIAPLGVAMARASQVESRIKAILDAKRPLTRQMGGRRATVLAAVILPFVLLTASVRAVDDDVSTNRGKAVAEASGYAHGLTRSGRRLTAEEAESLEKRTEKNPRDVASRTKLLGYYSGKRYQKQSAREATQRHILWLILNSPESEVLASPEGHLDAILDAEAYSQGKKAWLDQLKSKPENLRLLEHSSKFFMIHDKELAKESLQKARSLDRGNPKWPTALGLLYSLNMHTNSLKAKSDAAGKALEQFEIAYELSTDMTRGALLQYLAKVALAANKPTKAKDYAEQMLSQSGSGWNYGNNIHHGNAILGRIALALDDVEEAKERLVQSGKTPGSPQLNSFGPNMTLAKELLQKGERDVVLKYFELCSNFWKRGKTRLDEWSAIVKDGKIPHFGSNLNR